MSDTKKTVISVTVKGTVDEAKQILHDVEEQVINTVKDLMKKSSGKFCDPDFGPSKKDSNGAKALYRSGTPPNGYIAVNNVEWLRPNYEGCNASENPSLCENGNLFSGGHSAGDVNQGSLGDCWFLSSIAVLAEKACYLENIFFTKPSVDEKQITNGVPEWKEKGIWVCRFNQNFRYHYVIIDDRLPVNKKTKRLIFGHCEEKNELWVPLIEKAYAKLEGSYDSLIGGFIDTGLRDLTGLCANSMTIDPNNSSFSENTKKMIENGELYKMIDQTIKNGSMMGCSISPKPGGNSAAEADAGNGLIQRHAYSILGVITINAGGDTQLIVLRNPWGKGEWQGEWSDNCPKKAKYVDKIKEAWKNSQKKVEVENNALVDGTEQTQEMKKEQKEAIQNTIEDITSDEDNGIFLMSFKEWTKRFSQIFMCLNFPDEFRGYRIRGKWEKDTAGGNMTLQTWKKNPKYEFEVNKDNTSLFIQICQKDLRYQYGKDYSKNNMILGFHILPSNFDFKPARIRPPKFIPGTSDGEWEQTIYSIQDTNSVNIKMNKGSYILVPSTFERGQVGEFTINIYADDDMMYVQDSEIIAEEEEVDGPVIPPREKKVFDLGSFDPEKFEEAKDYYISKIDERNIKVDEVLNNYHNLSNEEKEKNMSVDEFRNELEKIGYNDEEDKKDEHVLPLGGEDGQYQISDIIEMLEGVNQSKKMRGEKEKHSDDDDLAENGSVTDIKKVKKVIHCTHCGCYIDVTCDKCNEFPINLKPSFAQVFICEDCNSRNVIVSNVPKPDHMACQGCKKEFKPKKKGIPCVRCKCGIAMSLKCPSCHKFSDVKDVRVPVKCGDCDATSLVSAVIAEGWKCIKHRD